MNCFRTSPRTVASVRLGLLTSLLTTALLIATACHKKSPAGAAATTGDANSSASQSEPAVPLPPRPAVAASADNAVRDNVSGEVHGFLTEQLRIFIQQKGRMPQSFAEFANARLDSVPTPPPGQKWVIDAANIQVKSAPK